MPLRIVFIRRFEGESPPRPGRRKETPRQKLTQGNSGPLIGGAEKRCDSAVMREVRVAERAVLNP
jgi:hypothetical protein